MMWFAYTTTGNGKARHFNASALLLIMLELTLIFCFMLKCLLWGWYMILRMD
jgi:hypothetical protein